VASPSEECDDGEEVRGVGGGAEGV
jgi:hypothetical protein